MFTFLQEKVRRVKKPKPEPWEKYEVGSQEWIQAHYSENGALSVSKHDLLLLRQVKGQREGFKTFCKAMEKLQRKMSVRERLVK